LTDNLFERNWRGTVNNGNFERWIKSIGFMHENTRDNIKQGKI